MVKSNCNRKIEFHAQGEGYIQFGVLLLKGERQIAQI